MTEQQLQEIEAYLLECKRDLETRYAHCEPGKTLGHIMDFLALIAEVRALRTTTSREEDHWYAKWVDERAALAEARRVLREVRMPPGLDDPVVWAGVPPDWFTRRDAVLAQEGK